MKKILGIINIILLLAAMMPLCVACSSKGENLPMPESIVIYNGGKQITLQNGDEDFSKAYALFRANLSMGILETAIEDEMINNAKQEFAAEFIYDDAQAITAGDITESVTGVLFFLSEYCEGEAAFSNGDAYHSGTVEFSCDKSKIMKIVQAHEGDTDVELDNIGDYSMPEAGWATAL